MELNFKSFGQGDPVIILHGLFGSLDNWQSFAKELAKTHLVYIVDQRDHGRSSHTKDFNYTLLAEDLRAFMEANWLFSAHIIGHSMGGKTAMQFASYHPDMVKSLIVLDIAPKKYKSGHDEIFEALMKLNLPKYTNRREVDDELAKKIEDKPVRAFLLKNLKRNKDGSFRWKMNLPLLYDKYDRIIGDLHYDGMIEPPSLFISGSESNYIKEKDIILIKELFESPSFETIENAGHWLHSDQPQVLQHIVKDFIT